MIRRRARTRTAPVRLLVALALLLLLVFVLQSLRAGSDAGPPGAGSSPGTSATPGRGPAASGLAVGPGPQQQYGVHRAPAAGSCRYRYSRGKPLPDQACTPGAVSPVVTQATVGRTICRSGYTKGIRPPREITDTEKRLSARAYGYRGSLRTAEFDHLVPLSLGGDPNDVRNLWLQPNDDPRATTTTNGKDGIESGLRAAVCAGRVQLAAAQRAIATDWVTAADQLGLPADAFVTTPDLDGDGE